MKTARQATPNTCHSHALLFRRVTLRVTPSTRRVTLRSVLPTHIVTLPSSFRHEIKTHTIYRLPWGKELQSSRRQQSKKNMTAVTQAVHGLPGPGIVWQLPGSKHVTVSQRFLSGNKWFPPSCFRLTARRHLEQSRTP